MAGIPIFDGMREQMLGHHHTAAPKGRELDTPLPVPEHRVEDPGHIVDPDRLTWLSGGPLAACVEPIITSFDADSMVPSITGVVVEMV